MPIFKIPSRVLKLIQNRIGSLFDNVKGRFLGPKAQGKTAIISFDPALSLPGVYQAAVTHEGGIPEIPTLDTMVETAANYIDSLKHKATNKAIKRIETHLQENPEATPESILETLQDEWKDVTHQLDTIVDSETQFAKNAGLLQGILTTSAALGITDPTVAYICVHDNRLCKVCETLHLMPDGVTPRAWKLSELNHRFHKKGDTAPSIFGNHPNERCILISIVPDYGFNQEGEIEYKKPGYDVLAEQRGNSNL